MAAYFNVEQSPAVPYATHATPNTEDPTLVLRQTARNCDLMSITVCGRAAAASTIGSIGYKVRRWTTVGSGGTSVTPAPTRIGATASTVCVDKASAITAGTVSGAIVGGFGCSKSGPGGWTARDQDDYCTLEGGSADEFDINSLAGEASLPHTVGCKIAE